MNLVYFNNKPACTIPVSRYPMIVYIRPPTSMSNLPINLPASIQQSSFRALDGLRGVSIAIVIIAHALTPFLGNSYLGLTGVYVFFVISGFLITTLLLKERIKYGRISLKGFYIRR